MPAQDGNLIERAVIEVILLLHGEIKRRAVAGELQAPVLHLGGRVDADAARDSHMPHPQTLLAAFLERIGYVLAIWRDGGLHRIAVDGEPGHPSSLECGGGPWAHGSEQHQADRD